MRALVLLPTRELADQVAQQVKLYGKYTNLRSAVVFGGIESPVPRDTWSWDGAAWTRLIVGAQPFDNFKNIIDDELASSK